MIGIVIMWLNFLPLSMYYYYFLKHQPSRRVVALRGHTLLTDPITLGPSVLNELPRPKLLCKALHEECWGSQRALTDPRWSPSPWTPSLNPCLNGVIPFPVPLSLSDTLPTRRNSFHMSGFACFILEFLVLNIVSAFLAFKYNFNGFNG